MGVKKRCMHDIPQPSKFSERFVFHNLQDDILQKKWKQMCGSRVVQELFDVWPKQVYWLTLVCHPYWTIRRIIKWRNKITMYFMGEYRIIWTFSRPIVNFVPLYRHYYFHFILVRKDPEIIERISVKESEFPAFVSVIPGFLFRREALFKKIWLKILKRDKPFPLPYLDKTIILRQAFSINSIAKYISPNVCVFDEKEMLEYWHMKNLPKNEASIMFGCDPVTQAEMERTNYATFE